ncbi:MAG: sigma-70 family RNA polymerase sigma factor [Saprospiraceae bacterium]|nr:sigma-70 family RNA polymerase sigma factor [Saprospiraceae bacterium]MCB0622573.1 sigma-70 family RNA polymerase sigma factor [Saprospiraceae bacterium]MCB0676059.1 sigma-70 family RNA polymerase sigma factor [Saprospiraceae bacterium]MCB0679420.1 sigma-70 family RNA polymerase sigma factor [Saprospiraceae bacterium]
MGTLEFSSQFTSLQSKLLPVAYRLTNNYEDAKDLVQETALRAYNNKEKFEMGTNFQAWVITIMRNTFINFYRKKKNRNTSCEPTGSFVFESESEAQENHAHSNLMLGELHTIIDNMSETYSRPFMMFYEGYKYEEIAEAMELPIGTVKSRIFFARRKLRETIEVRYPRNLLA